MVLLFIDTLIQSSLHEVQISIILSNWFIAVILIKPTGAPPNLYRYKNVPTSKELLRHCFIV